MFRNYLKAAFNSLIKNKIYSFINVVGLSIGLTACILIGLYVLDETSYDQHWAGSEKIFRVNRYWNLSNEGFTPSNFTVMAVMPALHRYFSDEIERGTRVLSLDSEFERENLRFDESMVRVDPEFLDVFELDVIAGSLEATLSDTSSFALRKDVAEKIFGVTENFAALIGKTVTVTFYTNARDVKVSAIYQMPRGNSILSLPTLALLNESVFPPALSGWRGGSVESFIKLRSTKDIDNINANLTVFTDQVVDISHLNLGPNVKPSEQVKFELQNISEAHLDSPFDESRAGGNQTVVLAFSAIAVLVLLIGTINYTVLSTAKATERAKEVAMRKVIGASRVKLASQFLGESFCIVLPAILISIALVEILLPVFETMVGKSLFINWWSIETYLSLFALYCAVSILGGIYPAFVLSHFRPALTLKGILSAEKRTSLNLRSMLLVFQFGISIALIIATSMIYVQVRHATNRDPGFNKDNILVIDNFGLRLAVNAGKEILKQEILKLSNVGKASLSVHQPAQKLGMGDIGMPVSRLGEEDNEQSLIILGIDYDFFDLYEIDMVAGRPFSEDTDLDTVIFQRQPDDLAPNKLIINETAARQLGFSSPEQAINSQVQMVNNIFDNETFILTIIGIAADTNFYSLNAPPRPEAYLVSTAFTDVLSVKYSGSTQLLLNQVTEIWRKVMGDAELATSFVSQNMAGEFIQERTEARMLITFSLLAIVIACLGLYGSSSFSIERRTKEIGIRKVMGAEIREIVTLLMWQFSKPVLLANVVAWPIAAWAMFNWLQRFPYQVSYLVLVPLCVLAGAIALSIAWITVAGNSVRVATRKPVLALRYE